MSEQKQAQLWKKVLQPVGSCPDAEELHALLEDSHQAPQSSIRSHIEACLRCSAELELMRKVAASEVQPKEEAAVAWMVDKLKDRSDEIFQDEAPPTRVPTPRAARQPAPKLSLLEWLFSTPGLTALASAVLVVVIIGGIWLNRGEPGQLVPPDGSPPVVRSQRIAQLAPSGDLTRLPERFSWQAVEGASTYRVQVLEVDHSEIWSGEASGNDLFLPEQLRQQIVPGKRLLWQVTAFDEQGRRLASSPQTGFRVEIEGSD
ncbi:MAG: hypothetical protein V3T83_00700 [Acidobacteriota bacterium]